LKYREPEIPTHFRKKGEKIMAEMKFEKALKELEGIVEKMEQGGPALDESLALFERGVKLARFLRSELERAEKKIELLLEEEGEDIKTEPFAPDEKNDGARGDDPDASGENSDLPF